MHTTACNSVLRSMRWVIVLLLQQPVVYCRFSALSMFCMNICFAASALTSSVCVASCVESSKSSIILPTQRRTSKFPVPHETSHVCLTFESRFVESCPSFIAAFAAVHSSCPSVNAVKIPTLEVTAKSSLRFVPLVRLRHLRIMCASPRTRVKTLSSYRSGYTSSHHVN